MSELTRRNFVASAAALAALTAAGEVPQLH